MNRIPLKRGRNKKQKMGFWPANSFYFITSKTFLSVKLFNTHDKKKIILNQIRKAVNLLNISIYAYSIAENHYHVLLYFDDFNKHNKFKQIVNGGSAFLYNKNFPREKIGKMWLDSKTLLIYNQESLFRVIGYIAGNLLKHQEAKNFLELKLNPFSNYRQLAKEYGDEVSEDMVRRVIKIKEDEDFLINLDEV
jgi:hypothetical protein